MNESQNIFSVLSGKEAVKLNLSVDIKSVAILSAAIFLAVLAASLITKKLF